MASTDTPKKSLPYHIWIVISCCVLMTTGIAIPLTCASTFFPTISEYLGVGIGQVSMIMTIQCVVLAVLLPLAGKLLAKGNVRLWLSFAVVLYAVGMGLMSFYTSLYQFYFSGVLMGIAGAFIVYLCVPLLIHNWFKKRVGLAMGFSYAFAGIGATIFSPITGYIIDTYGWRPAYLFLGIVILVLSLPFTLFVVRAKPSDIGLKPYGAAEETDAPGMSGTLAGLSGVPKEAAFKSAQFYQLFFFAGLLGIAAATLYQVTSYMVSLGYSTTVGSSVVAVGTIGVTIGKVGVGYLNDRIGLKGAACTGIGVGTVGVIVLLMGQEWGLPALFAGAGMLGVSYACTALEPPIVVRAVFGSRNYSEIFSIIMVSSSMGTAFGTSILGFIRDATGSFSASFALVVVMLVVALALVLIALKTSKSLSDKYADPYAEGAADKAGSLL